MKRLRIDAILVQFGKLATKVTAHFTPGLSSFVSCVYFATKTPRHKVVIKK